MDKYRITHKNSDFIVTLEAGPTIGVCRTQDEAKEMIEIREREDLILETARRLVKKAVNDLMRTHDIDRRTAQDWIKETVG
jgi:20S proteasome alpha/beta subunit